MADFLARLQAALAARYAIERELGRGGMAAVYLAHDQRHHRKVAIKVVKPEVAAALGPERFLREIEIAASLTHPHILPLHDSGEADGFLYYVMPFVDGESLRDRLTREVQLPIADALQITREVADALEYAHLHGVVHRDVKPENILLGGDHALVTDFGIARAITQAENDRLTETGLIVGTPAYMSPEQSTGSRGLDSRSDLYSLGCVLYEMLVGEPPFTGPTHAAVIARRLAEPARPVRTVRDSVPEHVERALARVLARVPADRFINASEFIAALDAVPFAAAPAGAAADSIAVLDFVNQSGDPSFDWLSSGIAETVTADLKRIPGLKIVSRDKVVRAQAALGRGGLPEVSLAQFGRDLGARWVVWGRFQTSGRSVRITPQVRDAVTDELLDTAKIDGPLDTIFALQDQVVAQLVEALKIQVADPHFAEIGKPETHDLKAYEWYARGRQAFNRFDPEGFAAAQEHYQAVIAVDPDYALAYAGLGAVFAFRHIATTDAADLEHAIEHLERAVALDPTLAQPYQWLMYAYWRQGRFDEQLHAGRRAIELDPDDATAQYFYGGGYAFVAFATRRPELFPHAIEPLVRSIQLEPAFHHAYLTLSEVYMFAGLYDAARPLLDRAVQLEETGKIRPILTVGALTLRGWLHLRENELEAALQMCRRSVELLSRAPHVYGDQFSALAHCGMGEAEYRRAAYDLSVGHWSRARELAERCAKKSGIGFVLVKALLGLGRGFRQLGMRREEEGAIATASQLMAQRAGYDFHWMWDATDAQTTFDFASYYAATGRRSECLTWLERAVAAGWRDRGLLLGNEDFAWLEGDPKFGEVRRGLAGERLVLTAASSLDSPSSVLSH